MDSFELCKLLLNEFSEFKFDKKIEVQYNIKKYLLEYNFESYYYKFSDELKFCTYKIEDSKFYTHNIEIKYINRMYIQILLDSKISYGDRPKNIKCKCD
jgi:hypothetical protein